MLRKTSTLVILKDHASSLFSLNVTYHIDVLISNTSLIKMFTTNKIFCFEWNDVNFFEEALYVLFFLEWLKCISTDNLNVVLCCYRIKKGNCLTETKRKFKPDKKHEKMFKLKRKRNSTVAVFLRNGALLKYNDFFVILSLDY